MDKDQYWKNRKASKRGQGPKPNFVMMAGIAPAARITRWNHLREQKHQEALEQKHDRKRRMIGPNAPARIISARIAKLNEMKAALAQ